MGLEVVLPRAVRTPVLASLGIAGLLIVAVVNWRLADLARESQGQREAFVHAGGRSSGGFALKEST